MNKVILIGRLVRDPELSTTSGGTSVCRFTLAVDRPYSKDSTERQADFLPCVAWRSNAEFVSKYFHKGSPCAVVGSVRTGSYDAQDGTKRYTTDIFVDNVEFVPRSNDDYSSGSKPASMQQPRAQKNKIDELEVIKDDDGELPF